MVELKNIEVMEYTLTLFENQNHSCEYFWTPLTDEKVEGQYKNINTGASASYLPWANRFPVEFNKQSNVILKLESKDYLNIIGKRKNTCTACDIPTTATFSLIGVCKDTYLGKK